MELRRAGFHVRGDVIDIFPAESDRDAIRVELFDDEIEALSYFDPLTGEVIEKSLGHHIPKSHYVTPRETIDNALGEIRDELNERLRQLKDANKLVELNVSNNEPDLTLR